MIVVDVGCHLHGPEESVHRLRERFQPDMLFGFDPHPGMEEGVERAVDDSIIVRRRVAAWVDYGLVRIAENGNRTAVVEEADGEMVRSIDLATFLVALPSPIVLKLDCEGAEFPILHRIHNLWIDDHLDLILVEWHEGTEPTGDFYGHGWQKLGRPNLRCPVEEW